MSDVPASLRAELKARRGREFAFGTMPARRTALVAIDLTSMFFGSSAPELALASRVNDIAASLRAQGGTVLWVRPAPFARHDLMQELLGPKLAGMHAEAQLPHDPRNQVAPTLTVEPEDLQARKVLFSAFFPGSSDAEMQLKARGVEYVLMAGVVTDVCVEASARDAFSCGFRTILLSDATRGSSDEAQATTVARFHRLFGDVRSVNEATSLLI